MTICDLCWRQHRKLNDAPETCIECSADMCPEHGEGEFCLICLEQERHLANHAEQWQMAGASA